AFEYRLNEDSGRYRFRGEVKSLHCFRSSDVSIDWSLWRDVLYVWYSGATARCDKGVVMAYLVGRKWDAAWYVGFQKRYHWRLEKTFAIAPGRAQEYLGLGITREAQVKSSSTSIQPVADEEDETEPQTVEEVLALLATRPNDADLYQRLGSLHLRNRE